MLEDYIDKKSIDWRHMHLQLIGTKKCPQNIIDDLSFISGKLGFYYADNLFVENPFKPMYVFTDGRTSYKLEDLSKEDVEKIISLISLTKHPIILGRLFDILWIKTHKEEYGLKVSSIYFNYFIKNKNKLGGYKLISPLNRSLYILSVLKKDVELKNNINKILNIRKYKDNDDKRIIYYYVASFISKCKKKFLKEYMNKFEKILNDDKNNDDVSLEFVNILIDFYKSTQNKSKVLFWKNKYVKICETMEELTSPYGYEYLQKAILILDSNEDDEEINRLMIKKDKSEKKMCNSFTMHEIPIDDTKIINSLNDMRTSMLKTLQGLDSIKQFVFLLKEFNALSIKTINEQIEQKSNSLINTTNNIVFDTQGKIVFESAKANNEDIKEYEIASVYSLNNQFIFNLIIQPYIYNLKFDDKLKDLLHEILSHNLFVPKERIQKVEDDINKILNKHIRSGLFDLIAQFENGCRTYLLQYKQIYPKVRHGSKYTEISLDGLLIQKNAHNKFRESLKEILGEDLILELEYLSCRQLSANIRNKYFHNGYGNDDEFFIDEAILSFILIKAYCLGYDSEIDKMVVE